MINKIIEDVFTVILYVLGSLLIASLILTLST